MAFEAYSVAVKLSLINHVSAGMLMISKSLATAGQDVDKLNAKLSSIGKQGAIGGLMVAGGLGIAAMFKAPLDEAKKFQNEVERFRSLGLGEKVTNDAVMFASGMNTYGTSIRENLGLLRDAQTVFGDFHEAQMVVPLLSKMKFANAALYGDEGGAMKDRAFMDMLKVIEMRGGLASKEAFYSQANMIQQVQTATGGRVGANEYLNLIKTGGVAAKGMKDANFYYNMEPLVQEMGGFRVGTGLMSGYQNLVQGRTTARAAEELMRIGMLDPDKVIYNKIGNIKQIKPGAVKGTDLMVEDPYAWMKTVMLPAFASKGITERQAILNEIGAIFTNRTASNLYSTMYTQMANIDKNIKLNKGAAGIDELDKNAKNTLSGKQLEFGAKWRDLMLNLGAVVLPLAIKALDKLNPALKDLAHWMNDNQGKVKGFTYALLGLSTFLIAGGLINMVIAAGRGFWLLGQAMIFVTGTALAPMIPAIARFGTYLLIFAIDFARAMAGFVLASGFVRGFLMAFLSPIKLIGQALYFFLSPLTLLLTPVGLVVVGVAAAAFLLWNNWKEVSGALKLVWGDIKTGFVKLFHGDIGGAFKSFALIFLTGWQTIFNTLIAGANLILPASMQISKTTFADDFRGKSAPREPWSPLVAPVPAKASQPLQVHSSIMLDGKKVGEAVTTHQAREAGRPNTGTQGFDPSRSMLRPSTSSLVVPRN
ncbi:phage tail tape measure protein [Pseudomonas sp. LB3P58]